MFMLKRSRLQTITLALFLVWPLAAHWPPPLQAHTLAPEAALADATLKDLSHLEELRVRFNQDQGVPRLILLLSPT